jgi:hypothetical protein
LTVRWLGRAALRKFQVCALAATVVVNRSMRIDQSRTQDRTDVAVVEDDAAAAAVAGEPGGAAPVAVADLLVGLG